MTSQLFSPAHLPSERRFGLLFVVVFAGAGLYGLAKGWAVAAAVAWLVAAALVGVALKAPQVLAPFNRAWFHFGELLGKVVSPIVMGLVFFGLLTPIAFVARLLGRDELRLKPSQASSYWIDRLPHGPTSGSFKNQF